MDELKFLNEFRVRKYVQSLGLKSSKDFRVKLGEIVKEQIDLSVQNAKLKKRKTVLSKDLY